MIKAFDNLEVWFVTGAQLLYGGDAVVQVDGHSQKMVDGMNASGILPVKLVYKGTANSSAEVADVMSRAEAEPKCIGGGTYAKSMPNIVAFGPIFPGDEVREHKPNEYMETRRVIQNAEIIASAMKALAE